MPGALINETARKIAANAPPARKATTKTKEVPTWSVIVWAGICSVVFASRMRTGMCARAIHGAIWRRTTMKAKRAAETPTCEREPRETRRPVVAITVPRTRGATIEMR